MRRWIFAALFLANLGLLLWGVQYLEPERPAPTTAQDEINATKMRLLSEVPPGKLAVRPKPAPPPAPTPVVDGQICYRLGPFAEAEAAKKVEESLGSQSFQFTRRDETLHNVSGYRVFLPPLATKEQAEQKRRELTQLGFKDHAVMQEEGFRNAVSLGVFSVEANAQSHLKRLVQAGVVAVLQPVETSRVVHWLELRPAEPNPELPARLKTLLTGVAGADLAEIPCPAPVVPQPVAEPASS
jgi:hypothetical protein